MAKHNLPVQATPFVGREEEIADISTLLDDPNCRLLTLCGPGGIGKTRLSIEVATQNLDHFPDGIWLVNLEPLTVVDEIVPAVMSALGVKLQDGRNLRQQLIDYLSHKHVLLIMDNFEHLLDGVGLMTDLLDGTSRLTILVTSREPLKLREEWIRRIRGLDVPDHEQVANLENYSAVRLFVADAHRVSGDFSLASVKTCVVRLCQMVEGLPLALELAASLLRVMPCAMIITELQHNLDLLESPLENMPVRHQSIRAVFEQSWRLLSGEERDAFKKLAIFRSGFFQEAATFVSGATLSILLNLVDKALLRVEVDGRYYIHSLLRQYVEEKLLASSEEYMSARDQHCDYYCEYLHARYDIWYMYEQSTRAEIFTEFDNIRQALEWGIERQAGGQLIMAMSTFCAFCGIESLWQEAHQVFERIVNGFRQTNHLAVLWRALAFQGWFAQYLGNYEQSEALYTESLAIGQESDWDTFNIDKGFLDNRLSEQAMRRGDLSLAKYHANEMGLVNDTHDKPFAMIWVLEIKGRVWQLEGNHEQASVLFQDALNLAQSHNSLIGIMVNLTNLGFVYLAQGNYTGSQRLFEESLAIGQRLAYLRGVTWSLIGLGMTIRHLGDYQGAMLYFCEALSTARKTGEVLGTLHTLIGIAELLMKKGKEADALEFLTYSRQHPAAEWNTRRQAEQIISELKSALPTEIVAQVTESVKTLDLDTIVDKILAKRLDDQQMSSIVTTTGFSKQILTANQALLEPLTKRELEVLQLIASGYSNRQIAAQLFIGVSTVKKHVTHILAKLGVTSRTQAINRGRELHLL